MSRSTWMRIFNFLRGIVGCCYLCEMKGCRAVVWGAAVKMCKKHLLSTNAEVRKAFGSQFQPLAPGVVRTNAGFPCDMEHGPCSCGAWH